MPHPEKDHPNPHHSRDSAAAPSRHDLVTEPPWCSSPLSKLLLLVALIGLLLGIVGLVCWYVLGFWMRWMEKLNPDL